MAFSQQVKNAAYNRAGGRCERCKRLCRRTGVDPDYSYPDSEFHHRVSVLAGGSDGMSNCEHLCIACHEKTGSYGKH